MNINLLDAKKRFLTALKAGKNFTATQARTQFGITSVSAAVNDFRKAGYPIFSNARTTSNGRTIQTYRLGTPTRRQIAAGYAAIADGFLIPEVERNLRLF